MIFFESFQRFSFVSWHVALVQRTAINQISSSAVLLWMIGLISEQNQLVNTHGEMQVKHGASDANIKRGSEGLETRNECFRFKSFAMYASISDIYLEKQILENEKLSCYWTRLHQTGKFVQISQFIFWDETRLVNIFLWSLDICILYSARCIIFLRVQLFNSVRMIQLDFGYFATFGTILWNVNIAGLRL